jgi:hypothetical protein
MHELHVVGMDPCDEGMAVASVLVGRSICSRSVEGAAAIARRAQRNLAAPQVAVLQCLASLSPTEEVMAVARPAGNKLSLLRALAVF